LTSKRIEISFQNIFFPKNEKNLPNLGKEKTLFKKPFYINLKLLDCLLKNDKH